MPLENSPSPYRTVAAAQKVAIASSVAALLMFGALVYNGSGRSHAAEATAVGTETTETTTTTTAVDAAQSEITAEDADAASDDADAKARKAATDLIRETLPGTKVDGVFTLAFGRGTLYLCGVDTIGEGGKHRTIDCLARLYVRRNGSQYWRAETLGSEEAARLLQKAHADEDSDGSNGE